jgi:GH15 family glucan-1,4-alpha-glucosidase
MTRGIDRELGRFVHAYGGTVLDASLLQLPRIGFVEASHPAMRATIEALCADLAAPDGLLYRNEYHGPKGFEGLFALVSFWLADCLIELGDLKGARQLVDRVWSYANDLGLMSEELDPETRAQLGNFPQAFSHTGRILTAVRLREAEQARRTSRG